MNMCLNFLFLVLGFALTVMAGSAVRQAVHGNWQFCQVRGVMWICGCRGRGVRKGVARVTAQ